MNSTATWATAPAMGQKRNTTAIILIGVGLVTAVGAAAEPSLAVLVGLGFLVIAAFSAYPFAGFLAAVCSIPLDFRSRDMFLAATGVNISLVQLVTLAAAMGLLLNWARGRAKWRHSAPDLPIYCILAAAYVSMAVNPSPDPGFVLRHTLSLTLVFALYFVGVQTIDSPRRLRVAALVLTLVCTLASAVGLYEFLTGHFSAASGDLGPGLAGRLAGLADNANTAALQAGTGLLFLLGYVLWPRLSPLKVLLLGSAIIVCTVVLILTMGRAAWLGTAVGVMALTYYHRCGRRLVSVLALICLVAVLVGVLAPVPVVERVKTFSALMEGRAERQDLSRIYHTMMALEVLKTRPVLGIGWGNFRYMRDDIRPPGVPRQRRFAPHNAYAYMAISLGFAGLLSYLWLLWTILRQMLYKPAGEPDGDISNIRLATNAAILCFLAFQLAQPGIYMHVSWAVIALSTAAVAIGDQPGQSQAEMVSAAHHA